MASGQRDNAAPPRPHARVGAVPPTHTSDEPHGGQRHWPMLAGLTAVVAVLAILVVVAVLFRGGFTSSVPVTVVSPRAGLVMDPDAKVKLRGVQVGRVSSLQTLPDGRAVLHLAMDPAQLQYIPANVGVNIASTTVFGAKFVQLTEPAQPSPKTMYAGQVLDAGQVTVEINTVFQKLVAVLSKIDPTKLNVTLGAIAAAVNGRGHEIGQMLSDLDAYLATLEPSLPSLSHDLAIAPAVLDAYADAAPDLLTAVSNGSRISQTIVDEQHNLDALLISAAGLADIGQDVLTTNRAPLTDVTAPAGTHHRPDQPIQQGAVLHDRAVWCRAAYQPNTGAARRHGGRGFHDGP